MAKHQDASLLALFEKTRRKTLSVLDEVPEVQAKWLPAGEQNHILWHAGHIFVLVERCIFASTVGSDAMPASIPTGWWPKFGWNSQPWNIKPDAWPPLAAVVAHLETQAIRLRQELASYDEAFLASPLTWSDPRWRGRPKRIVIIHGFYDELLHTGQIMQLKRWYDADQPSH